MCYWIPRRSGAAGAGTCSGRCNVSHFVSDCSHKCSLLRESFAVNITRSLPLTRCTVIVLGFSLASLPLLPLLHIQLSPSPSLSILPFPSPSSSLLSSSPPLSPSPLHLFLPLSPLSPPPFSPLPSSLLPSSPSPPLSPAVISS